ncbi:hypothetical protein [Rhizobium lentis]|uniref:hypothetical protein n=1 Tax=Rhizobium lentis TaxID=1138194 RepID=UPI002180CC91|nr:hypothetical protein [Rhizobium lentis]
MEILSPLLGDELASAVIEHRKRTVKKPLTAYAAKLQVKEYIKTGDPVAAAEMQILRGWQAIRADWYFNEIEKQKRNAPTSPPKPQSREEYIRDAIRRNNDDWEGSSDRRVNNLIKLAVAK